MTLHAKGTFEVQLTPQPFNSSEEAAATSQLLGRFAITKRFEGDLEATSSGQMLSAGTAVEGSAGYVVIEQVSGTLQGRKGSFVLQHSGFMRRGVPELSITVVSDSGTGELTGLSGQLNIIMADCQHFYEFEYSLEESAK